MKNTYVKELRRLLEDEVAEAEVLIAAKGFGQELQDMIEKVGRLMNEDLGPVVDQMRQTYGVETAENFQTSIQGELETVIETLRSAKDTMDSYVTSLASGSTIEPTNDMDVDVDVDADISNDIDGADDLENAVDDTLSSEQETDQFGGEEPLGRLAKESFDNARMRKIVELRERMSAIRKQFSL